MEHNISVVAVQPGAVKTEGALVVYPPDQDWTGWQEPEEVAPAIVWLARQDAAMGRALASLLADLGEPRAEAWRNHECASYPAMFALAAVSWRVDREAALAGFAFAWCESQVAAAVKIVPLGQTAGQRILARLASGIADAVEGARRVKDAEIGASEPGLAIASALHETQYTRLFRS